MTEPHVSQQFQVAPGNHFGDLAGKAVIVTGGNSGIGLGVARGLAAAGAQVAILGSSPERTQAAVAELTEVGFANVRGHVCDVGDENSVVSAFAEARDSFGRLDGVVASAGVPGAGLAFVDLSLEQWHAVLRVNLDGVFLSFREAARIMVGDGVEGSMVAIGSLSSVFGQVRGQSYSAGKGGVSALVRACATELARYAIRVNEILPGTIETPMADWFIHEPGVSERALRRTPMRRWGHPDEIAGAVVYLISDAARYHSGDSLVIDGGYSVY